MFQCKMCDLGNICTKEPALLLHQSFVGVCLYQLEEECRQCSYWTVCEGLEPYEECLQELVQGLRDLG